MSGNQKLPQYDEQQCFKMKFKEVEYYARLPKNAPGFYLMLWSQRELHGNGLCKADDECPALPIIEFGTKTFYSSLRSLWAIMPAVVIRLPGSAADRKAMTRKLQADLTKLKEPMGPCKSYGLMTGGGLPHGMYANGLRSIKGVDTIMQFLWDIDGRYVPGVRYMKTRQALLLTEKGRKSELDYHRDNNIFPDSPQVYRLQGAIIQHPPANPTAMVEFTRTGALLSIVAATNPMKRTMAEILATRDSQCECGRKGKGALDRPSTNTVLCGERMTAKTARSASMHTLVNFIKKNVDKRSYSDLPLSLLAKKHIDYSKFDKILAQEVGRPIKSMSGFLHALKAESEPRRTAVRGLMGGLDKTSIHKTQALSCAAKAVEVYDEARRTMDVVLIKQWIGGGGKGTKRSMTDGIQISMVTSRKR